LLKQAGYATMAVGKWHLGSMPEFLPTNRGFDAFYGVPYSNDMRPLPLMQNTDVVEADTDNNLLTQKYTSASIDFITSKTYQPFFLYLAHNVPHVPLGASPAFKGKSPLGPYADAVEELDWSVGQIVKALADDGLDQNTLVVVTSDNGPWFQGSPGRLRGRKGETYEGGMREPFVAYMPGTIPAGLVSPGVASMLDLLPTFTSIAGAPLPSAPLDGMNIWPLLTGAQHSVSRDLLLYFDDWNVQCARSGQWKLHLSRYNAFPWVAPPPGGRMNLPLPHPELYDVESDPEESYECSVKHPAVVKDILAKVAAALPSFPFEVQKAWVDTNRLKSAQTSEGAVPNPVD
jgi:arylsulfatase